GKERLDHQAGADLFTRGDQVGGATAEAPIGLGERNHQKAHPGHAGPDLGAEALGRPDDLLARLEVVALLEQPADRVGELLLFLRVLEVHDQSPSDILAMIPRWISFEPA